MYIIDKNQYLWYANDISNHFKNKMPTSLPFWYRKLVGITPDYISSKTTNPLHLDPAVLKSYVIIDSDFVVSNSNALSHDEQSSVSHRPVEQLQPSMEEERDKNDSTSESDDLLPMSASAIER